MVLTKTDKAYLNICFNDYINDNKENYSAISVLNSIREEFLNSSGHFFYYKKDRYKVFKEALEYCLNKYENSQVDLNAVRYLIDKIKN